MKKYTKEQLIFYIQNFHKKKKKVPTIKDINSDKKSPSSSTYANRFGSWNKTLIVCGFKINKKKYSKKEMIESVKLLSKELGKIPKGSDLKNREWIASYSTYRQKFGNWKKVLKQAGLIKKKSNSSTLKSFIKKKKK
ncbi:hypothetical protein HOD20_06050 [archaeon]|jgi:hypothetical protein|nr:hypothetical protein [archaeon]MBT4352066.1 hypothetical protein [archaeon]MBT4647177.1 hypothetical protein [archaeon]MBT6822180.1 hypothetical protein [archaeon]MBT7391745.1 hypothetical protein [archaeon]